MQTKSITKEGVNISYRVSRLENKPWLVMLHGWGSNHTIWTPYTHYFSDRFSMITPDLRGHGKSKNGHIDFHTLRKDLLAILDEEKVPKAEFLGHSIGATIAADFASHHPNRVSSLALATLSTRRYTFMRPLVQTTVAAILAVHPEGDRLFQSYWTDPHTPVRFTVPLDLRGSDKQAMKDIMDLAMSYNIMWNKIKCPTMILQGAYDPLSWNQRISNDIKKYNNIELQVLPTHHLLTTAKPSLVMQKLEVFWR